MSDDEVKKFYDRLQRHDWTYMMSDDPEVYRRGQEEDAKLRAEAQQNPEFKRLLDEFREYIWKGGPEPKI